MLNSIDGRLSNYAKALPKTTPNVYRRYLEKIKVIGYNDPYSTSFFARETPNIPTTVTTGHVIDYLVNFISPYTGQPMKNSRSMEGYKKFESGFVHSVQGSVREGYHVLVGKVVHSMKLKEGMLKPWIIVDKRGNIIYAHCTCVAGISETCSHVSAVLYSLANLHAQSINRKITVTDMPCYWRQPSKNIRTDMYKKVRDVSYGKISKHFYDTVSGKTRGDFENMLRKLRDADENAVILNTICDGVSFTCQRCQDNHVPDELITNKSILLQGNFNIAFRSSNLQYLRDLGRGFKFILTESDVEAVEKLTRKQRDCSFWKWVRTGRVTASCLKEVVNTSNEYPPPKLTLLKKICHPSMSTFDTPALAYGRKNEPIARKALCKILAEQHENLRLSDCGIFLDRENVFLAASPDCMGSCLCCGKFVVEIKCPYRLDAKSSLNEQLSLDKLAGLPNSFIKMNNDAFELVETHAYYFQIQAQIFITGVDFGLFMVWSKSESCVIKVERNADLWVHCKQRSRLYFYNIILPELLGNNYTERDGIL